MAGAGTSALRTWLIGQEALPDRPLVAGMPVSVRTAEQIGTGGNQIGFMLSALPTDEPDPLRRLELLHAALTGSKGAIPRRTGWHPEPCCVPAESEPRR